MNIFFIDYDPVEAAKQLCDKHVVSQTKETAQILSTVSCRYNIAGPYKPTHKNHPAVLWTGNTIHNWMWLVKHGKTLCEEYTKRYENIHKSEEIIRWCELYGGRPKDGLFTFPALCMPDKFKTSNYVESYRNYYINEKSKFAKWKNSFTPPWYKSL